MTRNVRPSAAASLCVAPVTVTDRSAPAVLGLEPRVFRELVIKLGVRHSLIGRRMIANVADVLAALDREAVTGVSPMASEDNDDEPTVDSLLARIGRRRTAA